MENQYSVKGTIKQADGKPLSGFWVVGYDRDLRTREFIGEAETDKNGQYFIEYSKDKIRSAERGTADIFIEIFSDKDKERRNVLAVSETFFNVPANAIIDLVVPAENFPPLSEYERLARFIQPLHEGLSPAKLEEDKEHQDITFLKGETGWEESKLTRYALAHRLADKSRIAAEFWYVVLASPVLLESSGESLAQKSENIVKLLPTFSEKSVRERLEKAFAENQIDQRFRKNVEKWLKAFHDFLLRFVSRQTKDFTLKQTLEISKISKKKQEIAISAYLKNDAADVSWIDNLSGNKEFTEKDIKELKTTFTLADMTMGNVGLVQDLKNRIGSKDVSDLAKLSDKEWQDLAKKHASNFLPPDLPKELTALTGDLQKQIMAKQISENFRATFPTVAFAADMERDSRSKRDLIRSSGKISDFLQKNSSFDLLSDKVDDLAVNEDLKQELKGVQRVFKLTNDYQTTAVLLADDTHSAQQIYAMGEGQFIKRYSEKGVDPEILKTTYDKAANTHAAVMVMVGELKAMENAQDVAALKTAGDVADLFPNWRTLFGAADVCDCEHCRSVYSPGAYFADILMFLKHRNAKVGNVKDLLFSRRPDLGYLELNCENANTELPYIDVVCEVLEEAISASDIFTLATAPVKGKVSAAIISEFAAHQILIADDAVINEVRESAALPIKAYTLRDDKHSFKIAIGGKVAELHQTRGKADELAAIPQYVNNAAYTKLKSARYPMSLPADYINKDLRPSLPFDLFSEEMRAYLYKHGINRWELMETLKGNAAPNNPTDGEIAAEYFGISIDKTLPATEIDEKTIILKTSATLNEQRVFWGEPASGSENALTGRVGNVNVFLNKTGLEYNDLLKLLDLSFINPTGNIAVVHDDSSCDTVMKHLSNLNFGALDRLQRFLRLWRKLGDWQFWELNLVIAHPVIGSGALTEQFLIRLKSFVEIKNRLEISVEETAGLFAQFTPNYVNNSGLNAESKFTEPFHDREASLYEKLFLNKKKINPLDPDFEIAKVKAPPTASLIDNKSVVMAALKLKEADLDAILIYEGLTGANTLSLGNLSKIYRHAMLMRALRMKAQDYLSWLKVSETNLNSSFATPQNALQWWERTPAAHPLNDIKIDELNYVLRADFTAKAAPLEKNIAAFLTQLRKGLKGIKDEYDQRQYEALDTTARLNEINTAVTAFQAELTAQIPPLPAAEITARVNEFRDKLRRNLMDRIAEIARPLLQKTGRDDAEIDLIFAIFRNDLRQEMKIPSLGAAPAFPFGIKAAFDNKTKILSFEGVMSDAEKTTLQGLSGNADYISAIGEMHRLPRLRVKFILSFLAEAALALLPNAVDFAKLPKNLADKISFDGEKSLLRFKGIMTEAEKKSLLSLDASPSYQTAITTLFNAPDTSGSGIWETVAEIPPLEADNVKIFKEAAVKLLNYFSVMLSDILVNRQFTESLAIQPDLAERILRMKFAPFTEPLVATFTADAFVNSQNVITAANVDFKNQFEHYYWLHRISWLIRKFNIKIEELNWLANYNYKPVDKDILSFHTLPVNSTGAQASYRKFLNFYDLFELQHAHSAENLTVLDIINKIDTNAGYTAANFGADMHLLHEEWQAGDVTKLATSLDPIYPQDYVFVESWTRLIKGLGYLQKLNGGAVSVLELVNPTVGSAETSKLKKLLRPSYSDEQWLEMNKDVQNILRNRKRDSLIAYLLNQPPPPGNPTSKWENANDLYAYYLLDVQMGDCMITSRLVSGAGSVQSLVQRCFMGLEPNVLIDTKTEDGDLRWLQWQWMKNYRVWEANRKIFLYPENWIEPQLRRDKSPFFKDLENELVQNEVNKDTVETAFLNYIDKLDNVAQLEIAGSYYEEAKDILHVFGRTALADPHIYYYRQFDENRGGWTAWSKIDVDITGDYFIPTMINERLYIFWAVFTEEHVQPTKTARVPVQGQTDASIENPQKYLKVQMAVSEFRNNKWQPKKISKEFLQSGIYTGTPDKSIYKFRPIDLLEEEGKFLIQCDTEVPYYRQPLYITGSFEVFGCKGIPEKIDHRFLYFRDVITPIDSELRFMKPTENEGTTEERFALSNPYFRSDFIAQNYALLQVQDLEVILEKTPGIFKVTRPLEPSFFDRVFLDNYFLRRMNDRFHYSFEGLASSFFYADKTRTFFIKPALQTGSSSDDSDLIYYPRVKQTVKDIRKFFNDIAEGIIDSLKPADLKNMASAIYYELKLHDYPPERIPEDAADIVRLFFRLYADFLVGILTIYLYPLKRYHFKNYYHPFSCLFAKQIYNLGIDGLMKREVQLKNTELGVKYYPKTNTKKFDFKAVYDPTPLVLKSNVDTDPKKDYKYYPMEVVDFTADGSYSQYNWELFYHAPLMIASRLSQNQRFEEARNWFHYIFNPLDPTTTLDSAGNPTPQKFWITKPFFAMQEEDYKKQRIEEILNMLSTSRSGDLETTELEKYVKFWRSNPFEPHVVAQNRQVAYQKTVIMKYLDNLISWGDQLFSRDTMESVNEATQLYVLAAEILGPRPRKVSPQKRPQPLSFNELEGKFDAFSNAAVDLENLIPAIKTIGSGLPVVNPPLPVWLYFCIPQNDKMLGYWDKVADRLYKIRHCMNIEGVVVKRSLFEPPIDPAALVNAIAGGASLGSALADLDAPTPMYRFNVMLQKANELCNDVKSLGGALLSALEKKDGEALALLRQSHELKVLDAVREVKEKQIEDVKIVLEGLKKNKEVVTIKQKYYSTREFINTGEGVALGLNTASTVLDASVAIGYVLAGGLKAIPNFIAGASGFGGSPHVTIDIGGKQFGDAAEIAVKTLSSISHALDKGASIANTLASYTRRKEDWDFQAKTAAKELENIDKQISGAELKIKIAEKELKNHDLQVENAKAVGEFMHSKYTNQELYEWMITQISQVYFQSYQLAYNLAKRAEKCYQFELGAEKTYLQFGYWDSLKKGLLSGEKLQFDLRRLENAYLEQNRREFELTKHISLALTHPIPLIELKEKGKCVIQLPEELFDFDYAGHYFRRVKSVSLSIPCVAGPYTTVNATLRLLKNEIRTNSSLTGGYAKSDDSDTRFRGNPVGIKAVATSSGQSDSGVFELNFKDDRYLPFEGAGVISTWSIELTEDKALQQFNYDTISDVILHLKYTAREDAGSFKNEAVKHLKAVVKDAAENIQMPLMRFFDIKHEFPNAYHAFKEGGAGAVLKIVLDKERFPFFAAEAKKLTINNIHILGRFDTSNTTVNIKMENAGGAKTFGLKKISKFGEDLKYDIQDIGFEVGQGDDEWKFSDLTIAQLNLLDDLYIIAVYEYNF